MNDDIAWVTKENMLPEHFHAGSQVLGIHARMVDGIWQYAVTSWWYGEFQVMAVFQDDQLIYVN